MTLQNHIPGSYHRYHIETQQTPDVTPLPNRFLVNVNKFGLASLLVNEIIKQRGDMKAVTSRPCIFGTFSGPVGGFAPRPSQCVGCLRCMIQHPEMVKILPNPARQNLGDSYFHFEYINTVAYEAETGNIPVKGAGYRGKFGGDGWDGMWTDMSEIVRPTRDGIHGREFISTMVDLGEKPSYLVFNSQGKVAETKQYLVSIPLPIIFDPPFASITSSILDEIFIKAAWEIGSLAVMPLSRIPKQASYIESVVPLVDFNEVDRVRSLPFTPKMIEINYSRVSTQGLMEILSTIKSSYPQAIISLRLPFIDDQILKTSYELGIRVFHLVADLHGRSDDDRFAIDWIRDVHKTFVQAGVRDEISLIGSGGFVAAEHVPKGIICGLDAVALDTPLLVALQAQLIGECSNRATSKFQLPRSLDHEWGIQRLKNLAAAWHSQLLEILGAMGLREVQRMRGEMGRSIFQREIEREVFSEIEGYDG